MLKRRCREVRDVRLMRVRRRGRKPVINGEGSGEEEGVGEGQRLASASASEINPQREANVNCSLVPLSFNL
jgi:hypothetical protein